MIGKILVWICLSSLVIAGRVYKSKENTWTCGVWLAAEEWQNSPTEAYFVFPKQEPIDCPVSATTERNVISNKCKKLGKKWSSVWSPTGGAKGREGDRICKLVADNMNVTSFPNQRFPRGIMLGYFYNMCGQSNWRDTGLRRKGNICCQDQKMTDCSKVLFQ